MKKSNIKDGSPEVNQLDEKLVKQIRSDFRGPIIGVIGATSPDYYYSADNGIIAGYLIRKFLAKNKEFTNTRFAQGNGSGHLFTGGVEGVGLDVYLGAAMYAKENKVPSKFFALIPEFNMVPVYGGGDEEGYGFVGFVGSMARPTSFNQVPYDIPAAYYNTARLLGEKCKEVRAGEDMSERRAYVAAVADVLVVLNGGHGTLDEAVTAIERGVPVIVVQNTGGAAKDIADRKNNKFVPDRGTSKHAKFVKFAVPHRLEDKTLNMDLVHVAFDEWDIPDTLEYVIKKK